jgi:cellulose synthase/poly-beta-1,6-N-acetylglucosamine synthase-like glycosyltransferase
LAADSVLASSKELSLRVEDIMQERRPTDEKSVAEWSQYEEDQLYDAALADALAEHEGRVWAFGNVRIGDYILMIDSDSRIPEDCFLDAASEMEQSPEVGILQHVAGTFTVGAGYFEDGIACK